MISDFISGFRKGMGVFGHLLSSLVNTVLLLFVYIIGVGITSIVAKLFRKHFLDMNLKKKAKSYWSSIDIKKKRTEDYYKQF